MLFNLSRFAEEESVLANDLLFSKKGFSSFADLDFVKARKEPQESRSGKV